MNKEELAWAAGFFDGEGTFGFYHGSLRASIVQKEDAEYGDALLIRFSRLFPFGSFKEYDGRPGLKRWEAHGPGKVQTIYAALYSYLGPIKRRQGKIAIEKWKANRLHWQICANKGHVIRAKANQHWCHTCRINNQKAARANKSRALGIV